MGCARLERMANPGPQVVLVGKPHCHLCEDARAIVERVCAEVGVTWRELSILDDPMLYDEYWERIPVLLVDGRIHEHWRIDPHRLRERLAAEVASE